MRPRPLNITLPDDLFGKVKSGNKKIIRTKRNPRKDKYFLSKRPVIAKINQIEYTIKHIIKTPFEWEIHI